MFPVCYYIVLFTIVAETTTSGESVYKVCATLHKLIPVCPAQCVLARAG